MPWSMHWLSTLQNTFALALSYGGGGSLLTGRRRATRRFAYHHEMMGPGMVRDFTLKMSVAAV